MSDGVPEQQDDSKSILSDDEVLQTIKDYLLAHREVLYDELLAAIRLRAYSKIDMALETLVFSGDFRVRLTPNDEVELFKECGGHGG